VRGRIEELLLQNAKRRPDLGPTAAYAAISAA
jgi:hypothetical protein